MKKCKYCQTEIDKKAKICPHCHKKQTNIFIRILQVFLGFMVVCIGIGVVASSGNSSNSKNSDNTTSDKEECYITLEEFNQIESGMTYEQVRDIVGCEGTVNSDTEVMDSKMTIYSWYGKDGISNANVNIQDGKLINKTQIGLE